MNTTIQQSIDADSFLLNQFREFYREVISLKTAVSMRSLQTTNEWEAAPDSSATAKQVWQRLLFLLERQETLAKRHGGDYGGSVYLEAQYVMAALADEIFLNLEWEGKQIWSANLLESELFQSHVAGSSFFEKLDTLLQSRDTANPELAAIYLLALSLGFQGKFRGGDDDGRLEQYRKRLYSFIFRKRFDEKASANETLFPEPYEYTLREGKGKLLPNEKKWLAGLAALIAALLIISHFLWLDVIRDIEPIIQSILQNQ